VFRFPERQRGSTLLLFPAALLIMVALAAITVDTAIAFQAQRELANATAAAANDAATQALSDRAFYLDDRIELSSDAVQRVAIERASLLLDENRHHDLVVDAMATPGAPGCAWTVEVTASSRVDELFGRAMPGSDGQVAVRAVSTASPRQGDGTC
jgi:Flp pilus assembly protein TadG